MTPLAALARRLLPVLAAGTALAFGPTTATEIQRVRGPGGIEAWLVQDGSVPVISLSFAFEGGAALDPEGKEGLADMVSSLLDEGAGGRDSEAFQKALEDIAASLDFDAGRDWFRGSLRTLSAHEEPAFDLLRAALNAPRFDPAAVERIRDQHIASLDGDKDNPRRIAGRTWSALVFGDHPYARPVAGTPRGVRAIARSDLTRFARERFAREGLIVGVAGDIAPEALGRRLDQVFGPLPRRGRPPALPEAAPARGGLVVVRKPIPQSVVVFGQAGLKRDHPDYYAAYVMNHILGGGGASRLTREIRHKRGLAYSVYSYLRPMARAGLIVGRLGTANARVATALDLVRSEWRRMARDGVDADELAAAKTYLNGSFPLRLDSTRDIAAMLVSIQINRLGIDYLDRRASLIDAVDGTDVKRLAARLLAPDKLAVVVVGDPPDLESTP